MHETNYLLLVGWALGALICFLARMIQLKRASSQQASSHLDASKPGEYRPSRPHDTFLRYQEEVEVLNKG